MADEFRELDDPFFDYDPHTGVSQRLKIDRDGTFHFVTSQDDGEIRQAAHEENVSHIKNERIGDFRRVATVPVVKQYELIQKGIWFDPPALKKWLNSADAAPYRTHGMRL
jgi:hypothetical protein